MDNLSNNQESEKEEGALGLELFKAVRNILDSE